MRTWKPALPDGRIGGQQEGHGGANGDSPVPHADRQQSSADETARRVDRDDRKVRARGADDAQYRSQRGASGQHNQCPAVGTSPSKQLGPGEPEPSRQGDPHYDVQQDVGDVEDVRRRKGQQPARIQQQDEERHPDERARSPRIAGGLPLCTDSRM